MINKNHKDRLFSFIFRKEENKAVKQDYGLSIKDMLESARVAEILKMKLL